MRLDTDPCTECAWAWILTYKATVLTCTVHGNLSWVSGSRVHWLSLRFLVQLGNFTRTLLGSRRDSSNSRVYIGPFAASSQIIIGPGDQLFCHGQSGGTAFEIGSVHGVTCQYVKRWHSILCAWNWE